MRSPSVPNSPQEIQPEFFVSINLEVKIRGIEFEKLTEQDKTKIQESLRMLDSFHKMIQNGEKAAKLGTFLAQILERVGGLFS